MAIHTAATAQSAETQCHTTSWALASPAHNPWIPGSRPGRGAQVSPSLLVVGVAGCDLIEVEQFPKFPQREVTFHVLLFIYHAAAQSLLVSLSLKDLLLYCSSLGGNGVWGCQL